MKHGCLILLILIFLIASGCAQQLTETPTVPSNAGANPPAEEAELETTAPSSAPTVPVLEPSPIELWAKSEVGPVYAQETHYAKPSPDGRYLYVFSMDTRNIIVLDLDTRTIVKEIKMPGFWSQATEMIFSPDGRWMYTLNAAQVGDRHIVVIDTQTKEIDRLIPLPNEPLRGEASLTLSPDARFLYVSLPGLEGVFRVNIETGETAKVLTLGWSASLAFTFDGDYLLRADWNQNSLGIIDPDEGKLIDSIATAGSPRYIVTSPDNQTVYLSCWESGDVAVVDLTTKKVTRTIPVGVNPLGMALTPDGHKLYIAVTGQALEHVSGERPSKLVVVDTTSLTVTKELDLELAPRYVNLSPDGTRLYVNAYTGRVQIIDTGTDIVIDSILLTCPAIYRPTDIAVTPDGSTLFVCTRGTGKVLAIDTVSHELLGQFEAASNAIVISSDGRRAYIPGQMFTAIDIASMTATHQSMPDIGGGGFKIVLSKDNRFAYVAEADADTLRVVDLENWQILASVPTGDMGFYEFDIAITPDGNNVFVGCGYSKNIWVFSTADNKVVGTASFEGIPIGIDFDAQSALAYIIDLQSDIRGDTHAVALDTRTLKKLHRWDHEPIGFGNASDIVVSPDERHVYFAGTDGECIVVLDVETDVTRYIGVGLDPRNLALSNDGKTLYVSNESSDEISVIDTQTEMVVDTIPIQMDGAGLVYAEVRDTSGSIIKTRMPLVRLASYEKAVTGNLGSFETIFPSNWLPGGLAPVPAGDYLVWANTNHTNLTYVSQIYNRISDSLDLGSATRVRVKEGEITSVRFTLQEGYQIKGVLVDTKGNLISAEGSITDRNGVNIGGIIGFGSGIDGSFSVVVPEGTYELYFDVGLVASGLSVHEDLDLGQVILSHR